MHTHSSMTDTCGLDCPTGSCYLLMIPNVHDRHCAQMRFVSTHSSVRGITAIAVSGNKKYFACVETVSDDKPQQVSVVDSYFRQACCVAGVNLRQCMMFLGVKCQCTNLWNIVLDVTGV